jgi:hypothetical protein
LHDWLIEQQVKVLNVAGNRESVAEGIGDRTRQVVRDALRRSISLDSEYKSTVVCHY